MTASESEDSLRKDLRMTEDKSEHPRQRRWLDECGRLKGDLVHHLLFILLF